MDQNNTVEHAYLDAYFQERRGKEIRRFIAAVFALFIGLPLSGFAEQIAAFLNASGSLNLSEGAISTFGLVINLCGFGILAMWILDGKDYVFPRKQAPLEGTKEEPSKTEQEREANWRAQLKR
jgi:hypothetical protein